MEYNQVFSIKYLVDRVNHFKFLLALVVFFTFYILHFTLAFAQGLNYASTYEVRDKEAVSGDILVNAGAKAFLRSTITYDSKVFGVLSDNPVIVMREEASSSARPIIREGDTIVNVNDYNGEIKKGDYITTSSIAGKGMKAGQSGYVIGIALDNAAYSGAATRVDGKQVKSGTVRVAMRIEYAELSTARNSFSLLNSLNGALFRSVQDPEKFTLTIRYIIAGLIALIAFAISFFTVGRSITKSIEAIGRNPLARNTIMASIIFQLVIALIGAIATVGIIYIIIRV